MKRMAKVVPAVVGLLIAVAGVGLLFSAVSCSDSAENEAKAEAKAEPVVNPRDSADYIGASACAQCHQQEHESWVGSHHDQAMKPATGDTVIGNFDNATFEHFGTTTRFFKKDGKYYVNTDGPDGKLADFEIKYTFGIEPLQQYLVEFEGGKVQALTICWDSRPKEQGGQRWYHLYPDEAIPHTDALHWAGPNFTWNHMCAECHSTDLQKHYDEKTDTYQTRWAEINVSCEACHGPGKDHAEWAELYQEGKADTAGDMGLAVRLKDETRQWMMNTETGIAERRTPLKNDTLVNACARCHSRRAQISENRDAGVPFLDHYRPSHLTEGLYYPDGQIQDEVYVWGSFVQSKMHMKGVTCVDCHDPHTARVPTTTNNLCATCHMPDKFDTFEHHHHPPDSTGAQCVNCHMPHRTYMGVDDRRDHSFRIPRPDLSLKLGTPNACNQCHTEQSVAWAVENTEFWWGVDIDRPEHFGVAFAAARENEAGTDQALLKILRDEQQPGIVRGTAVLLLSRYPTRRAAQGILEALSSDEAMVRLAATDVLDSMPLAVRIKPGIKMLEDPLRAVRIEAGEAFIDVPKAQISDADRAKVKAGIDAYKSAQRVSADTAAAQMNLGSVAYRLGDVEQATTLYERVLEIDPTFIPAYSNLASIYSQQQQKPEKALALLERAMKRVPDQPDLYYAQALVYIRQGNIARAMGGFGRAYAVAPERPDIAYAYGVALHDTGNTPRGIEILKKSLETTPNDVQVLIALTTINRDLRRIKEALKYAKRAQAILPEDQGLAQFVAQLEAAQ